MTRGKKATEKGITAIGRELLGFIRAIGVKVEAEQRKALSQAAQFRHFRGVEHRDGSTGCGLGAQRKANPRLRLSEAAPDRSRLCGIDPRLSE